MQLGNINDKRDVMHKKHMHYSIINHYQSKRKQFLPDDYIGNDISPTDVQMIGQYSMLQ